MEHIDHVACEHLCRQTDWFPTLLGSGLAATIAGVLGVFLGYF